MNNSKALFNYIKTSFLTGPKQNTVDDFWKMIWQEDVDSIVMLTNLKEGDKVIFTSLLTYTLLQLVMRTRYLNILVSQLKLK